MTAMFSTLIQKLFGSQQIFVFIVYVAFVLAFFLKQEFLFAFLLLVLLGLLTRIQDLRELYLTPKGMRVSFEKQLDKVKATEKKFNQKIAKPKLSEREQAITQEFIDEIFRLGFLAGGGKFGSSLENVKVERDEQGNILGVSYDQT